MGWYLLRLFFGVDECVECFVDLYLLNVLVFLLFEYFFFDWGFVCCGEVSVVGVGFVLMLFFDVVCDGCMYVFWFVVECVYEVECVGV